MSEKSEDGISSYVGVVLLICIIIILLVFTAACTTITSRIPFKMTVNDSEKDHIYVYVSNVTTQQPLPNVQIGIYNDENILIAGPLFSDNNGLVYFAIPNGYGDYFDVRGVYNGTTYTETIDRRSIFVKMDKYLGNISTPLYAAVFVILAAILTAIYAYMKKDDKKIKNKKPKIGKIKDEL